MGKIKFYKTRDHTKMKLFAALAAAASAQVGAPVNPMAPAPMMGMGGMMSNPLMLSLLLKDDSSSSNNDLLTLMMLGGGMGGAMGGQMNPLMLSLLLGDDVPKSKAAYDKICGTTTACTDEIAKIYNPIDGTKNAGVSDADVKAAHDAIMKYDSSSSNMSDLLLLSMMSGGGMQGGMQGLLPLLLLKDDSSSSGLFGDDNSLLLMMMMSGQNGMAPIMG